MAGSPLCFSPPALVEEADHAVLGLNEGLVFKVLLVPVSNDWNAFVFSDKLFFS